MVKKLTKKSFCKRLNPKSLEIAYPTVDGSKLAEYVKQETARAEADGYIAEANSYEIDSEEKARWQKNAISAAERTFRKQMRVIRYAEFITQSKKLKAINKRKAVIARIMGTKGQKFSFLGNEYLGTLSRNRAVVRHWLDLLAAKKAEEEEAKNCGEIKHGESKLISRLYSMPITNGSVCEEEEIEVFCHLGEFDTSTVEDSNCSTVEKITCNGGHELDLATNSCVHVRKGCTDEEARNFDPEAKKDDGSCSYIPEVTSASHRLEGQFTFEGVTYTTKIAMDQVDYGNGNGHKAYLFPENYKLSTTPKFEGVPGRRVECPVLKGPGLKGLDGNDISTVTCEFIERYGEGTDEAHTVFSLKKLTGSDETPAPIKALKENGKTIRGEIILYTDASKTIVDQVYPISLTLDVIDYRNGNDHKAFIKAERAGQRINTESLSGSQIRVTGCTHGMSTHQVDGIYGQTAIVDCGWKKETVLNLHHFGEVKLK